MSAPNIPRGKSMHGRIVQELGMEIVSGHLAVGQRLPHEQLLSERYEVSRPVLREAIRVLVAKGLIVSKQRMGAIVRPRGDWHLLDPDVLAWVVRSTPEGAFFETLMTVRRIIEPAAAALAATQATTADLEVIRDAYQRMENSTNSKERIKPDLEFHRGIFAATRNDLLIYMGNMLSLALHESIELTSRHPNTSALSLPRHKAILTAIESRDALSARQATLIQLQAATEDASDVMSQNF